MPAVRYVALAALVVWLGVTAMVLGGELAGGLEQHVDVIAAACGAVVFVGLFVMKFVGPPPHAFAARAAIAFVMFLLALYALWFRAQSVTLLAVNAVLGFVLLYWYSNE